jgi:hypothetical protein
MVKTSRKIIWAALFIVLMALGTFMLVWLFRSSPEDQNYQIEYPEDNILAEENPLSLEDEQKETYKEIPQGMKEINLPVNFFGDYSVLNEGDRVDIISTCYKEDQGSLCSERIITSSEIIRLEVGGSQEIEDSLPLGDAIFYDGISRTGTAIDMGNILVMTFFLTDDEVLRSFTALESGMLYIALCHSYGLSEWGND